MNERISRTNHEIPSRSGSLGSNSGNAGIVATHRETTEHLEPRPTRTLITTENVQIEIRSRNTIVETDAGAVMIIDPAQTNGAQGGLVDVND